MISVIRAVQTRLREEGWLRSSILGPLALMLIFVAVFLWGFYETGQHAVETSTQGRDGEMVPSSSHIFQRIWATLGLFTGSYISLSKEYDPMPPVGLSAVGSIALLLTLITAGSLLLLSRRVRDSLRLVRPGAGLIVVGNGETAAAIIKSSIEHSTSTILITDSRESTAGRATKPSIPIIASGEIQSALSTVSARRAVRRARHIVVATDSDALNMELYGQVDAIRQSQPNREAHENLSGGRSVPKDLVVIHDPAYADLLRPDVIRQALHTSEVTCPAENIAEHICHLIVAAVTGHDRIRGAFVEIVDVSVPDRSGPAASCPRSTLETWVTRLSWSMTFLHGKESVNASGERQLAKVPRIRLQTPCEERDTDDLTVEIIIATQASAAATEALSRPPSSALRIVVSNAHLIKGADRLRHHTDSDRHQVFTGKEWIDKDAPIGDNHAPLLVVDPDEVGLDAALVTDDTGTQWARTFDLTHGLMFFDGAYSVTGWRPGDPMGESTRRLERQAVRDLKLSLRERLLLSTKRDKNTVISEARRNVRKNIANRYSSQQAVEHMLELLYARGFELRRCDRDQPPTTPPFSDDDVEYIARKEHADWLVRTWPDTSRRLRRAKWDSVSAYSRSRANEYCYEGLNLVADQKDVVRPELRYAANYNRRIAKETYPAIAASFGYGIFRTETRETAEIPDAVCSKTTCPCHAGSRRDDVEQVAFGPR